MTRIFTTRTSLSGLLFSIGSLVVAQSNLARQGDQAFAENRYEDARQYWQQAIEKSPERAAALRYNQGAAAYRMEKFEEAESAFKEATESTLPPRQRADAWYNLGNAQLRQGKYEEAIASYRNSLKLAPGLNDAKLNLQYAKMKMKEQAGQSGQEDKPTPQSANSEEPQPQPENSERHDAQSAPQPSGQEQQPARKSGDELQRILEGIERADQKAGQKYRAKERNPGQSKPQKDW